MAGIVKYCWFRVIGLDLTCNFCNYLILLALKPLDNRSKRKDSFLFFYNSLGINNLFLVSKYLIKYLFSSNLCLCSEKEVGLMYWIKF